MKILGAKSKREQPSKNLKAPAVISVGLHAERAVRSDPLTGKCYPGYLGPGQLSALSETNRTPTCLHSPPLNPSSLLWGLESGHVLFSPLHNPLPTPGRLTGSSITCSLSDCHALPVQCIWAPPGMGTEFVSGGVDGRVKIWKVVLADRANHQGYIECVWESKALTQAEPKGVIVGEKRPDGAPDTVMGVRWDKEKGLMVAVTGRGRVWVWLGLNGEMEGVRSEMVYEWEGGVVAHFEVVFGTKEAEQGLQILLHLEGGSGFTRLDIPVSLTGFGAAISRTFVGSAFPLTAFHPQLDTPESISLPTSLVPANFSISLPASEPIPSPGLTTPDPPVVAQGKQGREALSRAKGVGGGPFVVAGDTMGKVMIWNWDGVAEVVEEKVGGEKGKEAVRPVVQWEAADGAITTVTAAKNMVATGGHDGVVKIWLPLTSPPTLLRALRNRHALLPFILPPLDDPRSKAFSVSQIILEADMIVASVGSHIIGWRAGNTKVKEGKRGAWNGQVMGKHSSGKMSPAKGYDVKEFKHHVHESKLAIEEEQKSDRIDRGWQDTAKSEYEAFGLDNTDEAVQYAIMMSQEDGEEAELERALLAIAAAEASESSSRNSPSVSATTSVGSGSEDERTQDEIELEEALEMIRLAESREQVAGPSWS